MTAAPARQEKYDSGNPAVRFVLGRFFARIREVVTRVNPGSVLDAGCGEGELLRRGIFGSGTRVISLDMRMAALAQMRAQSQPCRPVCGSVFALPFAGRSFDAVVSLEVLEHLEDPAAGFAELARVAQRAVIVSVPYEPYFQICNFARGKYVRGWGNHPEHIQHWNPKTFRAFLEPLAPAVEVMEAFPWMIACCRPR